MSRYLMTHSLLSSWLYAMKENPFEDATSDHDSYAEFLKTLNRQPTPTTEAMQKGIEFEDLVTDIVNECGDTQHQWYDAAAKVAGIVRGGVLQYKSSREIQVGGFTILLHGRLDCLKAGKISDIKFSAGYERGKYIDSTQHPTYFELIPEANEFDYLISNGSEIWTESYRREETTSIIPTIDGFLLWLCNVGLLDTYKKNWVAL